MDLFENTVLCKNCGKKMKPAYLEKEGFRIRALKCPSCSNQILHPQDVEEYKKFNSLRNRQFQVKLRLVGNSYTVSIPREIVNFMREEEEPENVHKKMQDHMHKQIQVMEQMVTLAMEEANKIGLSFNINTINTQNEPKKLNGIKTLRNEDVSGVPKMRSHFGIIKLRKQPIEENEDDEN
jgi:DNA-directed RNA polymerase subunit RPC12/RpoP